MADVASAFDKILHQAVEGHIYNIGGSNEVSVLQVAKDLMRQAEGMSHQDSIAAVVCSTSRTKYL